MHNFVKYVRILRTKWPFLALNYNTNYNSIQMIFKRKIYKDYLNTIIQKIL